MGDRDEIAPWRNFGAGVGTACPVARHALRKRAIATPPSATTTLKFGRSIASRSRYGWHRANSARVGLFAGGARRAAARLLQSRGSRPSPREIAGGPVAHPAPGKAPYRPSPPPAPRNTP